LDIKPYQDVLCWNFGVEQLQDPELVSRLLHRIIVACDLRGDNTYLQLVVIELMNNALDHGVLRLESSLKAETNGFARYYDERRRRLAELQAGFIEVSIEVIANSKLCIRVLDSGDGFDYRSYRTVGIDSVNADIFNSGAISNDNVTPIEKGNLHNRRLEDRLTAYTFGRGLTILRELCLMVVHVGCGNEVVVEMDLDSLIKGRKFSGQDRRSGTQRA